MRYKIIHRYPNPDDIRLTEKTEVIFADDLSSVRIRVHMWGAVTILDSNGNVILHFVDYDFDDRYILIKTRLGSKISQSQRIFVEGGNDQEYLTGLIRDSHDGPRPYGTPIRDSYNLTTQITDWAIHDGKIWFSTPEDLLRWEMSQ